MDHTFGNKAYVPGFVFPKTAATQGNLVYTHTHTHVQYLESPYDGHVCLRTDYSATNQSPLLPFSLPAAQPPNALGGVSELFSGLGNHSATAEALAAACWAIWLCLPTSRRACPLLDQM